MGERDPHIFHISATNVHLRICDKVVLKGGEEFLWTTCKKVCEIIYEKVWWPDNCNFCNQVVNVNKSTGADKSTEHAKQV